MGRVCPKEEISKILENILIIQKKIPNVQGPIFIKFAMLFTCVLYITSKVINMFYESFYAGRAWP